MGKRMTREEFLEAVFSRRYEELKGRELRTVRVRVVGKELSLAQLIGVTDRRVYENLGLHIGTHLGEDHTGQSIGLLHLTPWEATVVAADVAMKSGNVELGFLDRFSGAVTAGVGGDRRRHRGEERRRIPGLCRPLYRHGHHHGRAGGRHLCPDGDCKLLPR